MQVERDPFLDSLAGLRHFQTTVLPDGILLAGFDYRGRSVNVLDTESLTEWQQVVRVAERSPVVAGVVLVSLKEGNFCAGADLEQMHQAQERHAFQEIEQLVLTAHQAFDGMARSKKPFVAAIEGACLGGGLELALACHTRIVSMHPKTCLALPEVRLGILPGFGGTQRLPRVIGLPAALNMITTGKMIFPRQALRMGLADSMVSSISSRIRTLDAIQQEILLQVAIATARRRPAAPVRTLTRRLLDASVIRSVMCRYARYRVIKRVRHFYPAPLLAIDAAERGMKMSILDGSLTEEKPRLLELMAGPVSRYLVGLFLSGETIKRRAVTGSEAVDRVAVLGAGLMGSQIAGLLSDKGYAVALRDIAPEIVAAAMARIQKARTMEVRKKIILPSELRYRMMRIAPTTNMLDVGSVPFALEAVSEKLDVKRTVLADFESHAGSEAVFATNTSSYTLADITAKAIRPERCVGLHFFNPVAKMQLVEIVRAPCTSERALAHACTIAKRLGKFPLIVRDGPGFLVNRILSRYLAEAVILVAEGVPIRRVDQVARNFGMAVDSGHPMGPLELLDLIGLPVAMHVLTSLSVLGSRIESRDALLRQLVPDGRPPLTFWKKGRENAQACEVIDRYRRGSSPDIRSVSDEIIHRRLFLPMVDEAVRCLRDKIVGHPWEVDFALIHGIGFPAFRGGLLIWARQAMTPDEVNRGLESLARLYGKRFEPFSGLADGRW
ncbi:fatty acid oxidation complex subunit alpha [Nitrospira sp. KM1]|uniref:3-hydroxyacyl-CoA dehydrogenase NAD-binding domain-containing protein n=1 Tax=Nitrospira sp. KM1 TaxID=1936990 RepID=UPI0013A71DB6|nr:3-hydroxyacyl-CoA dehydrogenase NAD-binding domain-containing protein [Nitrospira sp. KM1]BCA56960.1 fatty acid oxidation complex subunit alpha [Nitrospira sp. KM1]